MHPTVRLNWTSLRYVSVALCIAAIAWWIGAPPGQPSYYRNEPSSGRYYSCVSGPGPKLHIRFAREGRLAVIDAGTQRLALNYARNTYIEDVYKGGGWKLTLDPEANLFGPNNVHFGSCN